MSRKADGKVAIVTGGGRGLGAAMTLGLARRLSRGRDGGPLRKCYVFDVARARGSRF